MTANSCSLKTFMKPGLDSQVVRFQADDHIYYNRNFNGCLRSSISEKIYL